MDLMSLLMSYHDGTLQIECLNYAQVVLSPKKCEARGVGDFKPISVLNARIK